MLIGEGVSVLWGSENERFPLDAQSSLQLLSAAAIAVMGSVVSSGESGDTWRMHLIYTAWVYARGLLPYRYILWIYAPLLNCAPFN